ncbi:glycosyltransferase family 4 protein [Reyranella soli]|uniref:Uncharacterized protein n=1 Tax=Reyranella soli TaxID=1230389 RepID=A0A512NI32_9HYPH|nr:glycosyltransferase family 4 protein [Reyranella soli]GEP58617.1 hypothetical protein RSO01_57830 [Reyranella soli]
MTQFRRILREMLRPLGRRFPLPWLGRRKLAEGRAAFKAGDHPAAERSFLAALQLGVGEDTCRLHLARIYNRKGDWEKALEQWSWLLQKDPANLEAQLQVARAQLRLHHFAEAILGFQTVLTLQPNHAEAQQRLRDLEASSNHGTASGPTAASMLLDEGKAAFKAENLAHSEATFLKAMAVGADEAECRRHLARIYNLEQDWKRALEQWLWLRDLNPKELEPQLQVARGQFRTGRFAEASDSFKCVLALAPDHTEAQEGIKQISAIREQTVASQMADDRESWVSVVPPNLRWQVASTSLETSVGAVEAAIDLALRQIATLPSCVHSYGDAEGELRAHRQLYALQAEARIDELSRQLREVKRTLQVLTRRTGKMLDAFEDEVADRKRVTPSEHRFFRVHSVDSVAKSAVDIHRSRDFETAVMWLFRTNSVDDRQSLLMSFGDALREFDRLSAIRAYWLAFGASPTSIMAERIAARMFQSGDLTNSSALVRLAPSVASSAVIEEMRSSISIFNEGIDIPPAEHATGDLKRLAYVASTSLPFQVAGYTVRTHQLLSALAGSGVDCICFTRPGYPWDRPLTAIANEEGEQATHVIGPVTYVHTPLPSTREPEKLVELMSNALEQHFRAYGCNIVQAASNSRNALPALIAARRTGARFIYEVRGLWELSAASRFPGWEATERYAFDRKLEVLVAANADHVLTINEGIAQELIGSGLASDRISVLPNAVDSSRFLPTPKAPALMASLELRHDDFVVVYAGSLTFYEGLDDLITAVSLMRQQGTSAKVVIVGDGEARDELQGLAINRGIQHAVIFVGRQSPDEISAYLSLADVVAIPRKPFEVCKVVSPLKPFEAMSMSKAVIVSDLPALREIVIDGQTGLICKPADPQDLARTLTRVQSDPELQQRLGQAARKWVIDCRSWASNAERLGNLYSNLGNAGTAQ